MISMCPTRLTMKSAAGAALALALGAAMLTAPAPARAGDDETPFESKVLRGLMEGLGLKRDGEAINYQERAPLVIPPGRDLPPPETSDALVANNPAWPKDPDVARRKEEQRLERQRISGVSAGEQIEREQRVLRPNEMTPGGNPRTPPSGRRISGNLGVDGTRMSPSELGYKGGLWSNFFGKDEDEAVRFTGEPPRAALTEPPAGYRTPSPDQPYGGGKAPPPKATDSYTTRGELKP